MSAASEPFGWTRTEDHVRLSTAACYSCFSPTNRCPIAMGIEKKLGATPFSSGDLFVIPEDEAMISVDCSAFHLHQSAVESGSSTVIVRCVGTTPDAQLSDSVYWSVANELGLEPSAKRKEGDGESDDRWMEELGRQLPPSNEPLTLILCRVDRLDKVLPVNLLPANIRLLATASVKLSGWTCIDNLSITNDVDNSKTEEQLLERLESQHLPELVRKSLIALAIASGRNQCGLTAVELKQCLESLSCPSTQLDSLIRDLDPLLIQWTYARSDDDSPVALMCARTLLAEIKRRYYDASDVQIVASQLIQPPSLMTQEDKQGTTATIGHVALSCLRWLARLFSSTTYGWELLDRDKVAAILFDWNYWRWAVSIQSDALAVNLLVNAVRNIAVNWVESQWWILHDYVLPLVRHAPTAGDGGRGVQHLASQMVAVLRPFADKGSSNTRLWRLYQGVLAECDQFAGPLLATSAYAWNWRHCSSPTERTFEAEVSEGAKDVFQRSIQLLAVSPDGQTLVVVTGEAIDPFTCVSVSTGRRLAVFRGHRDRVTCVRVTDDGCNVISGSEDLTVIVWELMTGNLILRISEHIAPVSCVSSVLATQMVVSGGEDSILMAVRWPGGNGERLARIDHHRGPILTLAITHRQDVLVSGSQDGSICLWSLEDWSLLNAIVVGQSVAHITLSSDDVFLLAVGLDDGLARLFSLTTGSPLRTWEDLPVKVRRAVIVGDNGHSLAALLAEDGRLMCYDCHSGLLVHSLLVDDQLVTATQKPSCCARSNDPRLLYHSVGNRIKVWLLCYEEKRSVPVQAMTSMAVSPSDGTVVAAGDRTGSVHLWRSSNLSRIAQWSHPAGASVTAVSFDPTGLYVASGAEDGTVAVWHLDAGCTLAAVQVHPLGQRVCQLVIAADWCGYALSCDVSETMIQWKLGTGEVLRQWSSAASKFLTVANNTRWMAASTGTNSVRLWSLDPSDETKEAIVSHSEEVTCMTVTFDSRYLITGSKDSSLKMWEGLDRGGKLVQIMAGHSDQVTAVATTQLALQPASPMPVNTNAGSIKQLVVVSGSRDGQLIVWDAQHGSEIHSDMERHGGAVTCLKVSTDGTVLVSGSADCTVRVWGLRLGNNLSSFALGSPVQQISMTPDASKLWVRMNQQPLPALLDLRHTPAVMIKLETPSRPASPIHLKKAPPTRRLLKKEISLDSYTWLKRYGSKNSIPSTPTHQQHSPPTSSMDSLLKLARRNSYCNVPEGPGET